MLRDRASRTEDIFQKRSEEEVGEAEGKVLGIGILSEGGSIILETQEGLEKLPEYLLDFCRVGFGAERIRRIQREGQTEQTAPGGGEERRDGWSAMAGEPAPRGAETPGGEAARSRGRGGSVQVTRVLIWDVPRWT